MQQQPQVRTTVAGQGCRIWAVAQELSFHPNAPEVEAQLPPVKQQQDSECHSCSLAACWHANEIGKLPSLDLSVRGEQNGSSPSCAVVHQSTSRYWNRYNQAPSWLGRCSGVLAIRCLVWRSDVHFSAGSDAVVRASDV